MTKRSSAWLVFLILAIIAITFTAAMTFEDLRIGTVQTIRVQYFVAGGGAAAMFAAIAMYLWLGELTRRRRRIEKRIRDRQAQAEADSRDLIEWQNKRDLAKQIDRQRATDPTEKLPVFAIYGSRPKADKPAVMYDRLRQQVAFDLTERTGDTASRGGAT
jgi:uncharacterized membrane protein